MKHEIHRLRPVMLGHRCIGHLLEGIRGIEAYTANDKLVGVFDHPDAALSRLRGERGFDVIRACTHKTGHRRATLSRSKKTLSGRVYAAANENT